MSSSEKEDLIKVVYPKLADLTTSQVKRISDLVEQFQTNYEFRASGDSDLITEGVLNEFGDVLREHHSLSEESFTKDKFEYALEKILNQNGIPAEKSPSGNPGDDITIRDQKFSLKTQADKTIKKDFIHISKFHELGKGDWSDKEEDLIGLREQFFNHMKSYDRILTLRQISKPPSDNWHYELVEIPKSLLEEAKDGEFEMMHDSTQNPKPGYCRVYEKESGGLFGDERKKKFELYFDGGGERKLQIKAIDKSYCTVHADWIFAQVKA